MRTYRPSVVDQNAPASLRAKLLLKGDTVASWARRRGHDPELARRVAYRWAGRRGLPRGRLTRAILRDLSLDLGIQIPPGIDWREADAVAAQAAADPRRRAAGKP